MNGGFTLLDAAGRPVESAVKGVLGGNRRTKIYGRLDCRVALRHVANGTYQKNRVFFADAATARAAGYRACKVCRPVGIEPTVVHAFPQQADT